MDRIVVGIDGSEASKDALRWAVDEARAHGAEVIALHVYEAQQVSPNLSPTPPLDVVGDSTEVYEAALGLVTSVVEEVVGQDANLHVVPLAVEGITPESVLIDASRQAALLVVGSRGHSELADLVLGSVSLECAQHAACPVVLHRRF